MATHSVKIGKNAPPVKMAWRGALSCVFQLARRLWPCNWLNSGSVRCRHEGASIGLSWRPSSHVATWEGTDRPWAKPTRAWISDAFAGSTSERIATSSTAASVPSNFVEGFRKRTTPDKIRFYNIAQGSADECLYQLILAHDLNYLDTTALQADLEEVSRLLQGYINGLGRSS